MSGAEKNPTLTPDEAVALLAAGGILPPGTEGAGERVVALTARTYRHPGLDDRVVVRLTPGELGAAEGAAAGFLGLTPDGAPVEVGLGLRQSLGFPEWVLVHYPEDGHQALALLPELERAAKQVKSRPKAALQTYQGIADRLAAALPHFLPTFHEQVGRAFLAAENSTFAAQQFTKARRAESAHGLDIDESRLDDVFLEFALAGALPAKALVDYGKALSARVPAPEALHRYTRLCARRTAGGLTPSAQLATELRRLAKLSGADAAAVEREYLAGILTLPATLSAPEGWWKSHRAAIVELLRQDPDIRRALLDTMPGNDDGGMPRLWLAILTEAGVIDALHDAAETADAADAADAANAAGDTATLPADGASGWLRRYLTWRNAGWRTKDRIPDLYPLVERSAARMRAELAAADRTLSAHDDLDLLDLFLHLGVPVADPADNDALSLQAWGTGDSRRDLAAVEADPRFRPAFGRGADGFRADDQSRRAIRKLIGTPGGRVMLTEWVASVAGNFAAAGLPGLPDAMRRLEWLPGEALALAADEVLAAARTDLAPVLARTLRAGLLDEFAWPAWEEAVAELVSAKEVENLVVADAWPYLVVAGPTQVRVLGPEGTVLTHDLRIPAKDAYDLPGFHYVDGELLVHWRSRKLDGRLRGYWHHTPDEVLPLEHPNNTTRSVRMYYCTGRLQRSLALADGARTTGNAPLRRGDTALPAEADIISDGRSYWVWTWDGQDRASHGWFEYDPATGARGRRSMPAFLADALKNAPAGSEFRAGRLDPAGSAEPGPTDRPVDGLVGYRIVRLPGGSVRIEDLEGVTATVPRGLGEPVRVIRFPGDGAGRAVLNTGTYDTSLVDPDGVLVAQFKTDGRPGAYAKGTPILPPYTFWQYLRPRDEPASLALRAIDDATAAQLVAAGHKPDGNIPAEEAKAARRARIRELLPALTHEGLVSGINGVIRQAAQHQAALERIAERLEEALTQGPDAAEQAVAGPGDRLLGDALGGLAPSGYSARYRDAEPALFGVLQVIGRELRDAPERKRPIHVHTQGPRVPASSMWETATKAGPAAAFRMVSPFAEPEHREAVQAMLAELDALGLVDPGEGTPWRRIKARILRTDLAGVDDGRPNYLGLLPLDGGAWAVFLSHEWDSDAFEFSGLMYDPSGRFEIPAPYSHPRVKQLKQHRTAGWLGAFLAEAGRRGEPAPWFPDAADRFAGLTGVTPATARLVVAGLPRFDRQERGFLTPALCKTLGVKSTEANVARDRLKALGVPAAIELVGALLPADPARLWTDGPDVDAAAEVWNRVVGRKVAVPEALSTDARRAVKTGWDVLDALPAVMDPASAPELTVDLGWAIKGDRARPVEEKKTGFDTRVLTGTVPLTAWLAHQLPAGHPVRAALPAALAAVRARLAAPGMMVDLGRYVGLPDFRKTAGPAAETTKTYERYGAVVMATHDMQPAPALRVDLLDSSGSDPFLPALRGEEQRPFPAEIALRLVRDPRFEALLADPGDPAAGSRDADGTWAPQDPTRSVPDLVAAAAADLGVGEDAAAVYLMILAMPDPTDRNTARWTGWKPARLKAARAELAGTDAVVEAVRARAGRTLFLPGGWADIRAPHAPMEAWKLPFFAGILHDRQAVAGVLVPLEPAADLYRRAWQRIQDGDRPRFEELKTARRGRRR